VFTARYDLSKCNSSECRQSHGLAVAEAGSRLPLTADGAFESRPVYVQSVV
jgi:hypothetical protein